VHSTRTVNSARRAQHAGVSRPAAQAGVGQASGEGRRDR
jgi:hypothetical protein